MDGLVEVVPAPSGGQHGPVPSRVPRAGRSRLLTFSRLSPRVLSRGPTRTAGGCRSRNLVLDADESVRKGVERLFHEAGLGVTVLADIERAKDQVANRFFPVVLADLDTPRQDSGIELVKFVRERSPLTAVVVMSRRIGFDAVARCFARVPPT